MDTSEFFAEDEVTPDNIAALFARAFYNAFVDDDSNIVIDDDPLIVISVNKSVKLLTYTALYGFKPTASFEAKYSFVNRINDEYVLARFAFDEDTISADYALPYERAIFQYQIVSALRLFSRVVPFAISSCDEEDIIR